MTWQSLGNNTLLLEENRTFFLVYVNCEINKLKIVQHASVISVPCLYDSWIVMFS